MRRLKTLTLSLLTVLLGVTAWAQASRDAQKAPRAVGDVKIASITPAAGAVESLYQFDLIFNTDINVFDDNYNVGEVLDSDGNKVRSLNADLHTHPDWDLTWCSARLTVIPKEAITEPGEYTVVIFANTFGDDPDGEGANPNYTNAETRYTYTIGGGDVTEPTRPQFVKTTPSVPVSEISTVEVTFDQPVVLSKGAQSMPTGVWGGDDFMTSVTTAVVSMKEGDDTTIVYTLAKTLDEPGEYAINVDGDTVFPKDNASDDLGNEMFMITVTVDGEAAASAKFELAAPKEDTIEDTSFGAISFNVNKTAKINANVEPYLRDENGQPWDLQVIDMISMANAVVLRADDVTISGVYTLTVPEGFIVEADGTKSKEFTKTWTYINPTQGGGDITPLQILSATLVNDESGDVLDLMNPDTKVPMFGRGWTLHVTPNNFDEIQEINLAVTHYGVDEYGNEGTVVDKRIEMYAGTQGVKTDTEFVLELYGSAELLEGVTYTLTFDAEDTHVADNLRKDYGMVTTTVQGGAAAYQYSPAYLVSVYPEVGSEIYNPNQEFTLTFSQPVDISVEFNEGMGVTSEVTDVRCNEDRTVWYFTLSASIIEKEKASLGVIVAAKDLDGKVLDGRYNNAGIPVKEKSVYSLMWDCHLGCPAVTITPASGTLESIWSFTAVAADNGAIALGSFTEAPYLTTASGAVVATLEKDSEVMYNDKGEVMNKEGEGSDEASVKITFNLDKEITAPGKYILVCPFAAFSLGTQFTGSSSRPMFIEYLIEGTPEWDRVSIADGAQVSELSYVVAYVNADVDLAENARMQLRSDDGVLANTQLIKAVKDGVTMLIADFTNEENKPLVLDNGVDYRLRIAANSVMLAGTDMAYPELNVNITGASDVVAPVVNLTQNIAGSATTVSSVAAGSSVAVKLIPADGWKVEKVLFNNEDVTANVASNAYTTPALESDATLDVTFAYDGTLFDASVGSELITDFNLFVGSENGEIVIRNLTPGMIVNAFTIEGAHMGSYTVGNMDVLNIKVPAGVYVVTVTLDGNTQAVKVVNK